MHYTDSWRTASGRWVILVDVAKPGHMSVAEARQLIAEIQREIARAESNDAEEGAE
jgi:hypothetical protein